MDLAIYIHELLGLEGEVNVPGLGYFSQTRINGYYNEKESKFYPPTHEINFDPQAKEDDGLAKYIANKKNISLASSKYFIEKYVIGVKQQLDSKRVEIAGLGYLYTNGSVIAFTVDQPENLNDPAFYGFPSVNVTEPEEKPLETYIPPLKEEDPAKEEPGEEEAEPVKEVEPVKEEEPVKKDAEAIEEIPEAIIPEEVTVTEPTIIEESETENTPEYEYEEPVRDRTNLWVGLLLVVIIALLAILGLYKFKPQWFNLPVEKPKTIIIVKPDTSLLADADTSKVLSKQDSATKQPVAAQQQAISKGVDTLATLHYEILGGAFKSLSQTNAAMKNYEKLGLKPRLLKHIDGKNYIITLGTFFDKAMAEKTVDSISNATKINKANIFLQTYKPKK